MDGIDWDPDADGTIEEIDGDDDVEANASGMEGIVFEQDAGETIDKLDDDDDVESNAGGLMYTNSTGCDRTTILPSVGSCKKIKK